MTARTAWEDVGMVLTTRDQVEARVAAAFERGAAQLEESISKAKAASYLEGRAAGLEEAERAVAARMEAARAVGAVYVLRALREVRATIRALVEART